MGFLRVAESAIGETEDTGHDKGDGRDLECIPLVSYSLRNPKGRSVPRTDAKQWPYRVRNSYFFFKPSSSLRKGFSAPETVFSGPVSLKNTLPPGPSTMAPSSRYPGLGVEGPIIEPPL